MHEIDLRYSMLRYLTWLIPSLGFIGTVVLLQSLVQAKEERALNEAGQYCLDHLILRLGGQVDGPKS